MRSTTLLTLVSYLFLFCNNDTPHLTNKNMEWKLFNRNVDQDDPNYPIEVIEDGYKMIRAFREEPQNIRNDKYSPKDRVEWGWKFTFKNICDKPIRVYVTYILEDKDQFDIVEDNANEYVDPGETATIRKTSYMDFQNVNRVVRSGWKISYWKR